MTAKLREIMWMLVSIALLRVTIPLQRACRFAHAKVMRARCAGHDRLCPCQDGDACHYRDAADGTKAWPLP